MSPMVRFTHPTNSDKVMEASGIRNVKITRAILVDGQALVGLNPPLHEPERGSGQAPLRDSLLPDIPRKWYAGARND